MREIKILDCTLRDGGYVNGWKFKEKDTLHTITSLIASGVELIECGFLDATKGSDIDCTRFQSIEKLNTIVQDVIIGDTQLLVAMIEYGKYEIDKLPIIDEMTNIKGIRYSFRKSDFQQALLEMPKIIQKGYKLFVQPISTSSYSDEELLFLLEQVNKLNPYAVYVVDTQGAMFKDDFKALYELLNQNLDEKIHIGFHSHNNMQLSYSIAIDFIDLSQRDIIIDASVYGMGRGAGNLNTELLADYLNRKEQKNYDIDYILELIDSYYYAIFKHQYWGYSLAHFLSASLECHPNYASYLLDTKHLSMSEIRLLLSKVPFHESYEYNKSVIETIYFDYNAKKVQTIKEPHFVGDKKILLIGSGKNLNVKLENILAQREEYLIIALNHKPQKIVPDFYFFNTAKRYNEFKDEVDANKVIVSSNLEVDNRYVLDYQKLSSISDTLHNDNSAVMMIHYLFQKEFQDVFLAGVDGFSVQIKNYLYEESDRVVDGNAINQLNDSISQSIEILSNKIEIIFLTSSIFEKKKKIKVVGVIPSRYASTRLPQKPLVDICGLPMVIHVMKRAMMCEVLDEVIVATDDQRIYDKVFEYGGKALMTSKEHQNGTLRMQEVSTKVNGDIFVLLNGDEPLLEPHNVEESINGLLNAPKAVASLLVTPYDERDNPSNFKVALNRMNEVMYISRNDIPSDARSEKKSMWKAFHIVAYRKEFLDIYANELEQSELDAREMDDQLRILEYGYTIQAVKTQSHAMSVDTLEDLEKVRELIVKDKLYRRYKDA